MIWAALAIFLVSLFGGSGLPRVEAVQERVKKHVEKGERKERIEKELEALKKDVAEKAKEREELLERFEALVRRHDAPEEELRALMTAHDELMVEVEHRSVETRALLRQELQTEEWRLVMPPPGAVE